MCPSGGFSISVHEICILENKVYAICTCKYGQKIIDGLIVCHSMNFYFLLQSYRDDEN